jgi:hypothetical protein
MPNESQIDQLREEAWAKGVVTGRGVDIAAGPIPRKPGYYGQPVVRPPVWTWEIPIYFFVKFDRAGASDIPAVRWRDGSNPRPRRRN